eukprot:IDg10910t1
MSIDTQSNIQVEATGTGSRASLGIGEICYQHIRGTFRKMRICFSSADKNLLLQLCVKAMNDTLGIEGLVPSSISASEYSKVYTPSETQRLRPTTEQRAAMLKQARAEMQINMEKSRASKALLRFVPTSAEWNYNPSDKVLVWRGNVVINLICEWMGPFTVIAMVSTKWLTLIQDVKIGNAHQFNVTQLKPYYQLEQMTHNLFHALHESFKYFSKSLR